MTDTKEWVLPNGFTYIASTAGWYGSWAKATDPVTAARKAARDASSSYPQFVSIWYAPDETTNVNEMGGLSWMSETADRIIPIGFFQMSKNSMKVSKDSRLTNHEFVTEQFGQFRKSYDWWVKNEQKQ